MTTRTCACVDIDALVCAELRWYGHYPALNERTDGLAEYCGCLCHENWDDDD